MKGTRASIQWALCLILAAFLAGSHAQGAEGLQLAAVFSTLRPGDTIDKMLDLLGPSASEADSEVTKTRRARWNEGVRVVYDPKTRRVLLLGIAGERAVAKLRAAGADDKALRIVGMHRDEVVRMLGRPGRASSDNYEWALQSGNRVVATLNAVCTLGPISNGVCDSITITWNWE